MNTVKHWYLITYDIRNPKRLQRLHRYLRTQGYALQESVFAWQGDQIAVAQLKRKLVTLIRPQVDDLRLYRLPHHPINMWGVNPFAEGVFTNDYPPHQRHSLAP